MDDENNTNQPDHDILIELRTEMRGMRTDMKVAADDTRERLLLLGANKLEKDQFHAWEISHATESGLREKAIWEAINGNAEEIKKLKVSDQKQNTKITYVAGALAVIAVVFSIIGPLLTQIVAKLLHIN